MRGVYPPSFTPGPLNGLRTAGPQSGCTHRLSLSLTNMSRLIPLQPFSRSLLLAFQTEAALFPPNICSMYLALLCPSLANLPPPMPILLTRRGGNFEPLYGVVSGQVFGEVWRAATARSCDLLRKRPESLLEVPCEFSGRFQRSSTGQVRCFGPHGSRCTPVSGSLLFRD